MFCTLKVRVSPSESVAVGVKEYALLIKANALGAPDIVGALLDGGGFVPPDPLSAIEPESLKQPPRPIAVTTNIIVKLILRTE